MGQAQSVVRNTLIDVSKTKRPVVKRSKIHRITKAPPPPPLVWIDVETTGLTVGKDKLLEIGLVITDSNLKIISEPTSLVIGYPSGIKDSLNGWCRKAHQENGLIQEVLESNLTKEDAERMILGIIKRYCPEPNKAILAGNNVGFDRKFIEYEMPVLAGYLHFRNIDVSTINELAKRWAPRIAAKGGGSKQYGHRALDDILESINELQFYQKKLFRSDLF